MSAISLLTRGFITSSESLTAGVLTNGFIDFVFVTHVPKFIVPPSYIIRPDYFRPIKVDEVVLANAEGPVGICLPDVNLVKMPEISLTKASPAELLKAPDADLFKVSDVNLIKVKKPRKP
jgi:hypothetical protein